MRRKSPASRLAELEHRPWQLTGVAVLVSLSVSVVMAALAGWSSVGDALARLTPGWLAVAAGARVLAYAGYTLAHHRVMNACESAELGGESPAVVAFGAGATSLKGGFAVDRRALRAAGASRRKASVHVLALGLLEYAVLAPAAWVSALALLDRHGVQGAVSWPWLVGVPAGAVICAVLYRLLAGRLGRGRRRPPELVARSVEAARVLLRSARSPARGVPSAIGMAVHWFAEILCLWAALRAFGLDPDVPVVVLGYATGLVLTPRTLPLAGAGVIEVLLPLSLMWVGIGLGTAVVAVLAAELTRLAIYLPLAVAAEGRVRALVGSG